MRQITGRTLATGQPLYSGEATRQIEQLAAAALPPHTLMQRAGLSVARLTLALAPHARCIWMACGPGNNGGDGFEAALQLHLAGKKVVLTWTGLAAGKLLPPDAEASRQRALQAGLVVSDQPPEDFDFCIDALLGLGASSKLQREGMDNIIDCLRVMQASRAPRLCIDLPSGLNADTGESQLQDALNKTGLAGAQKSLAEGKNTPQFIANNTPGHCATSIFTLSFLVLKPGLFTAMGRDCAGEIWLDDLGIEHIPGLAGINTRQSPSGTENSVDALPEAGENLTLPTARLLGADCVGGSRRAAAAHASHKGSFGDVAVVGGESSATSHMAGAALLAANAALHAGAGRVFVALLPDADHEAITVDVAQPELMFRSVAALDLKQQVIVCGCGGGQAVKSVLPQLLSQARRLVLDADALNAIAADSGLQILLKGRQHRSVETALTPHPLEAARLLGQSTAQIQADRLSAAQQLAVLFGCTVVLKGSGSIIAAPGKTSAVNSSGNALLATAGTGDVLAGMLGAGIAAGYSAFEAACQTVYQHGRLADEWARNRPCEALTASRLAKFRP